MSDGFSDQPDGATPIEDTSGLLQDITTRRELDESETLNVLNAIEWLDRGRIKDVFTVTFYCDLHKRMFEEVWDWAGVLRTKTGNQVGEPFVRAEDVTRELGRVAMEFGREWQNMGVTNAHLNDLLSFLARYHHALVVVHPFNNGNGRWSRLATDAVLQRAMNRPSLIWATTEATLVEDSEERKEYITALRSADAQDFSLLDKYLYRLNPSPS